MATQIKTVGIVGGGVIGASWAALFLSRGLRVIVSDPAPNAKDQLVQHIREMWSPLEKLGLHKDASINNLTFAGVDLSAHGQDLDYVQENGPEQVQFKKRILADLTAFVRPEIVIASSSSGLPSSQFVGECKHPERLLIGHPFNPPHLMPLVEVVPHPGTSDAARDTALSFYKACGRSPVLINQEVPGFAANRLQAALVNEADSLVSGGILSASDVDICMTNSLGPRWAISGPFISSVLAGGSGGFKHFMEHLGPATRVWLADMKAREFQPTEENVDALDASVQKILEKTSADEAMHYRDEKLVQLLNLMKE